MNKRVLLHIGTHRTGSTSVQHFLRDHPELLASVDTRFPVGLASPSNHGELHLLSARPEHEKRTILRPEWREPEWLALAAQRVRLQLAACPERRLVYSAENLSYLRHESEIGQLLELFAPSEVGVVVFLRDPADFLRSYRQSLAVMGVEPSTSPDSIAYLEPDSWLADYQPRMTLWSDALGPANVTIFDYDACRARDGSTIPAFTDLLGIERESLPDVTPYFLNRH